MRRAHESSFVRRAEAFLLRGIEGQMFTAAQVALARADGEVETAVAGKTDSGVVTDGVVFDIASLTKLFSASACLRLVDARVLDLSDSLCSLLPGRIGGVLGAATLEQLLAHEAGFEPWRPLFEELPREMRGTVEGRENMVRAVLAEKGRFMPGTRAAYSDLGYMALSAVLEAATGLPLNEIVESEVTRPLGLGATLFHPLFGAPQKPHRRAAPTEKCPWRGRRLVGEVHDDNAWSMGGVSGHAGLFAPAVDIARFGAAWLKALGGGGWLSRELACHAVKRRPLGRALGWDVKSPESSAAGRLFGDFSFGHLGFTGCSLWVDPERGVAIALLANRVYFGRENESMREFRPAFHDALMEEWDRGEA